MLGLINKQIKCERHQADPSHFICLCYKCDKSVYFLSRGSYLFYNATIVEEIKLKQPHSVPS